MKKIKIWKTTKIFLWTSEINNTNKNKVIYGKIEILLKVKERIDEG